MKRHYDNFNNQIDEFINSSQRGNGLTKNGKKSFSINEAVDKITRDHLAEVWKNNHHNTEPVKITYSFPDWKGVDKWELTPEQQNSVESILQSWEDLANLKFIKIDPEKGGDINFCNTDNNRPYCSTNQTFDNIKSAVVLNNDKEIYNPEKGNYGPYTFAHEIGHALGLSHPSGYGWKYDDYRTDADYAEDSKQFTVMSYWSETETGASTNNKYPSSPMIDDISAIQKIHQPNIKTRSGDTIYGFNSNSNRDFYSLKNNQESAVFSIWDAGGDDTLDFSGYEDNQRINLNEESFSDVGGLKKNVSIARGAVIENAIGGSGNDLIIGNKEDNIIKGGKGNDIIYGGEGQDQLWGRYSNDKILIKKKDQKIENIDEKISSNSVSDIEDKNIDNNSILKFVNRHYTDKKQGSKFTLKENEEYITKKNVSLEERHEKIEEENNKLEEENREEKYNSAMNEYVANNITTTSYKMGEDIFIRGMKLTYFLDEKLESIFEKQKIIKESLEEFTKSTGVVFELIDDPLEAKIFFGFYKNNTDEKELDGKYYINIQENYASIMHQLGHVMGLNDLTIPSDRTDVYKFTVMSPLSSEYPNELQDADRLALQKLYSFNSNKQEINVEKQSKLVTGEGNFDTNLNIDDVVINKGKNHKVEYDNYIEEGVTYGGCVNQNFLNDYSNYLCNYTFNFSNCTYYPMDYYIQTNLWTPISLETPINPENEESNIFVFKTIKESKYGKPSKIMDFETGFDKVDISLLNQELSNAKIHFVDAFQNNSGEAILKYDEKNNISDFLLKKDIDDTPDFELQIVGQVSQSDFLIA